MFSCALLTLLCASPSLGHVKVHANTYHILSDGFVPWMFIHAPLPHVSRRCFKTRDLTGPFKAARNAKHGPNPPKFLLVHTKADLRHSDVNDLVYILPVNDMKPVWFPLLSHDGQHKLSVTCFSLKLQAGSENENSQCFPLKDTTVSLQNQPFHIHRFSLFSYNQNRKNILMES